MEKNNYKKNYERNVKKENLVEKKGKFDYISWANCEKIANELDDKFNWLLLPDSNGNLNHNGFVLIKMEFLNKTRMHYYPILDFNNKPISNPTAFDLNNAQMRGMSKLFSMMSGIGLSLFTGEDLSIYDKKEEKTDKKTVKKKKTKLTQKEEFANFYKNSNLSDDLKKEFIEIYKINKDTNDEEYKKHIINFQLFENEKGK